jgi:hypothetical protein
VILKFTDGMEINTAGEYAVIRKSDGLYVVGHGMCCPVDTSKEGEDLIKTLSAPKDKGRANG